MSAPVLLPARLIRLGAERLFLAAADGLDAVRDFCSGEGVLYSAGSRFYISVVVLSRRLITVTLSPASVNLR
jgi:hypothetical protein